MLQGGKSATAQEHAKRLSQTVDLRHNHLSAAGIDVLHHAAEVRAAHIFPGVVHVEDLPQIQFRFDGNGPPSAPARRITHSYTPTSARSKEHPA